jgi:hypothetical protein
MIRTAASILVVAALVPCLIAAAPTTQSSPKADVSAKLALSRKLPEVKFSAIPLSDAIDYLRDVSGANIHVNWRALELLNVTRQTPVSLKLNDVTMRRVMKSLLDETGAGELLTWYIDEGVIEITTREIADQQLITKVYPVEDLVMEIPNFAGPTFNLQNQSNQTSGQGGGGGSSQSLFSGSGSNTNESLEGNTTKQSRADSLVKLITDTVQPEVWRENGGTAAIRYFNGHIIVTAPRSVHEALSGIGR